MVKTLILVDINKLVSRSETVGIPVIMLLGEGWMKRARMKSAE
jgi:hypothetical protein